MDTLDQSQNTPAPSMSAQNKKMFTYGLLAFVGILVVGIVGVTLYRVYRQTASDRFTVAVATVLNLPAVKVNGVTVPYKEYVQDWKAINTMRDYDRANSGQAAQMTDSDLSDQVVMRYVNNVLIEQAAKDQNVKVDQTDIDALKNQVLAQFKTVDAVNAELQKRYGWDFEKYQSEVMRPYILQSKLAQKIQADPGAREAVRKQAQTVLDQIKAGADFATMAKQYGQDGTKDNGGDLGWFGKGDMVPQFEAAAFALKKGQITQELVESTYGYHIIKLNDRKMETSKDASGKSVTAEKIDASHILFLFPSVQTYLQNAIKAASVHIYLHIHNPLTALKK